MIDYVHITNFQIHWDLKIQFSSGINVIAGPSDIGKTAVLRALRWLVTNKPRGDSFRPWSGGKPCVEASFDQGSVIVRHSIGRYDLKIGKTSQVFKAVGSGVPEPVRKALNVQELSWQMQMDPPFLVSDTPGEITRKLNAVCDLEVIDRTLSNVLKKGREHQVKKAIIEERVIQSVNDLRAFDFLHDAQQEMSQAQKQMDLIRALRQQRDAAVQLLEGMEKALENKQELCRLSRWRPTVLRLHQVAVELQSLRQRVADMCDLAARLEAGQRTLMKMRKARAVLKKEYDRIFPTLCPLCGNEVKKR